jgi:predicted nucleic acid-binding protein
MTVLVDSSVWINHFRRGDDALRRLLDSRLVCTQEPILGELISGRLARRDDALRWLLALPRLREPSFDETAGLIEREHLWGQGLSWIDCLILAGARLNRVQLWTRDLRLTSAARRLGCAYPG